MNSIRQMIHEFIANGGAAQYATVGDESGVYFTDESPQFMPWSRLGYSETLGFYDRDQFPDHTATAIYDNWTIHPVVSDDDGWEAVAALDEGGHGFLIGERWQAEELYHCLAAYLERGEAAEPLAENDEALGSKWLTINEAMIEAHNYDPAEYPLETKTAERIRRAAQRGSLAHKKTESGRYKFPATRFRGWLRRNTP